MEEKPLYQQFSSLICARQSCIHTGNEKWLQEHERRINKLIDLLPHGSGIDYDYFFDFEKSTRDKIIFSNAFHVMDEYGYYDGIIDFTIVVKPSLLFDFDLLIKGKFGNNQDLKEYLYDTYDYALRNIV